MFDGEGGRCCPAVVLGGGNIWKHRKPTPALLCHVVGSVLEGNSKNGIMTSRWSCEWWSNHVASTGALLDHVVVKIHIMHQKSLLLTTWRNIPLANLKTPLPSPPQNKHAHMFVCNSKPAFIYQRFPSTMLFKGFESSSRRPCIPAQPPAAT